jgi:hypothetical protein
MKTTDTTHKIRSYLKTLKLERMAAALDEKLSRAAQHPDLRFLHPIPIRTL